MLSRTRALIARLVALRWPLPLIGITGIVVATFVLVYFQPQALFISNRAAEQLPTPLPRPEASQAASSAPVGPLVLAQGDFRSLEHASSGHAAILKLADGTRYLRFENLSTSNGPDLRVYLSRVPASGDWFAYGHDYIDLGGLRANQGDQNYEVPASIDLTGFRSAVIWCRRFTVGFAVAPLDPA